MEMKVTYIANDGTEFENREECLAHEKSFSEMSEFIQFFDQNFLPVEWNPDNYERMWNRIYYIVIEPHREEEAEEWWSNTFYAQLGVSPFSELDDWSYWLRTGHGDEPTIIAYDFNDDDDWVILNEIYSKVHNTVKSLDLVDALS
jgi:hypothetical protein